MATQLSTRNTESQTQGTSKTVGGSRQPATFYSALTELVLQQKRQRTSVK